MGGKHLKKLRAEKSKVHLKKKTLSKANNVTNTAFTVKKILTVEQLQKVDKNEPVSNWNVPLKELLIRLNHYNFTARLNGLSGIKELLTKYPEILEGPSLKLLINKLLELITDEEHKIRVTTVELLSYVFSLISLSSITAFQRLLSLYLGCAMTHRNASVQQDSLRLIDVVIKYAPEVVKCNFKTIGQNFWRIMKSYLYESHVGVFSSGKSKQDIEKQKREMLLRFYQFITAGYPRITEQKQSDFGHDNNSSINVFMSQKPNLRELNDHYKKIPELTIFRNSENKENLLGGFSSNEFISFSSMVIPLLLDTWVEFSPNQSSNRASECMLTESGGELLLVLLNVLLFLYDMAIAFQDSEVENWFITNYSAAFEKSFLHNFPYLSAVSTNFSKSCNVNMMQNLIICYLAYSLKLVDSKLESKIENFVTGALMITQQETDVLLKVVKVGIHASRHRNPNVILNKVVAAYNTTDNPKFKRYLSEILMNTALEGNGSVCMKDQGLMNWMKSLPDRLCQPQVFVEEVKTVLKLIMTSTGAEILSEIELKAESILENLQNIKVEGITELEGKKMIADILYRCSSKVLMAIMMKRILDGQVHHPHLKNYILGIFSQKLSDHLELSEI